MTAVPNGAATPSDLARATDPRAPLENAAVDDATLITRVDQAQSAIAHQIGQQQRDGLATERFDAQSHGPPAPHQRRSAIATEHETPAAVRPFQAVWEVDVFDVPATVADLFFDGKRHQQIAQRVAEAVETGLRSILITSRYRGEGRSSVAIGMAMAAAAAGIRVALIDADSEAPSLVDDLRLDLQYGWIETIRGGLPIKEVAVRAVEDGVTLIPLMPPGGAPATPYEVTQVIEALQDQFDLLIIDGPPADSCHALKIATAVDSAIVVRDINRSDAATVGHFASQLQDAGVRGIGIVDNFV
jgi:Mrp family chromosome partitioning ATPase